MDSIEKKLLHRKTIGTIIAVALGAIIVFIILQAMQQFSIQTRINNESEQILTQVAETLKNNRKDMDNLKSVYHDLNQSTAEDLREVLDNGLYKTISSSTDEEKASALSSIIDRSDVPYLFIMDSKGNVIAAPDIELIGSNLVSSKLLADSNLETLISTANADNYVKESNKDSSYYFYSVPLQSTHGKSFVVYGTDATVIDKQLASLRDVSRVIKNIAIGEDGFVFAVDKKTKEFIYYTDDNGDLSGKSATEFGLKDEALKDNYSGSQEINGTDYYCVSKDCGDYTIAVAATDFGKTYTSGSGAWQWSIAGFIIITLLCIIYAGMVSKDLLIDNPDCIKRRRLFKHKDEEFYCNISVLKRIMPVILLSVFIIFGISYYSRTLLGIRDAVNISSVNLNELENSFADADTTRDTAKDYYESQYLAKARILALLFEENPDVLNKGRNKQYYTYDSKHNRKALYDDENNELMSASNSPILSEYCERNDFSSIYLFDEAGRTIATNDDKWYFTLSFDEKDQSYPFRDIIDRKLDSYVQEMGTDDVGEENQYIGVPFNYYTTRDKSGDTKYVSRYAYEQFKSGSWSGNPVTKHSSLLQIGVHPEVMANILASTQYEYLLKKSALKDVYLVLFDDSEDHNVLYSPAETSIGMTAADIGFNKNAFYGDYIGFQRVNGKEYLIDIQYKDGYYIGSAILKSTLFEDRLATALITALFGLIVILFMTTLVTLSNKEEEALYAKYAKTVDEISDRIMFLIPTPAGERSMTEKALSRWDNKSIPWRERTPEQKLATSFFAVIAITIIFIMLFAVLVGHGKIDDPVLAYVITGNWDKGINIFAMTACGLIFVTAILAIEFLNIPIRLITRIFGTKSETVGHLLTSVLKYFITLYSIFFCLYLLGINSTSLLTSAGILSLIVGFGSQSLIKDIVAGIFIIFEGEFRVGDIVTINDYRGQVLDVGLRTTKLLSSDHNIRIINNSEITEVINMTRVSSVCSIEVPIAFGVSIDEVEAILADELPTIRTKVPAILDGPHYKGVKNFTQKQIMVEITTLCKESDVSSVRSNLYREVLDIIYRNNLYSN